MKYWESIPIMRINGLSVDNGELVEPDVEIELDDYRSYKRPKRSGLLTSR